MKRLFLLTISLFLLINGLSRDFDFYKPYYGINFFQSSTGSGYGSSMNINFNVQKFNRVFEVGLMFNAGRQQITGIEFSYKHFLGFHSVNFYKRALKPFFHYNFLYRMPANVIVSSTAISSSPSNIYDSGETGKMTTFEHAVGFGLQLRLVKQFYCEGNVGFGAYFGSHYQGSTPASWGIHLNNYGFVPSFKLGFGYQF